MARWANYILSCIVETLGLTSPARGVTGRYRTMSRPPDGSAPDRARHLRRPRTLRLAYVLCLAWLAFGGLIRPCCLAVAPASQSADCPCHDDGCDDAGDHQTCAPSFQASVDPVHVQQPPLAADAASLVPPVIQGSAPANAGAITSPSPRPPRAHPPGSGPPLRSPPPA